MSRMAGRIEEEDVTDTQRLLTDVMERYGESWSISRSDGPDVWTAVCRPTSAALHVLVAHSLPELSEKLEKASPITARVNSQPQQCLPGQHARNRSAVGQAGAGRPAASGSLISGRDRSYADDQCLRPSRCSRPSRPIREPAS